MLLNDTYKTISGRTQGNYKNKGSKFIALALPVSSEQDAKQLLNEIRNEFYNAHHHCFAYMIGADKSCYRSNDDGEPSGTAGRPILGQINSRDLTNVLVVVNRFFGGTKLGIRGLINAYKFASSDALDRAEVITETIKEFVTIKFNYPEMNNVMRIINENNLTIKRQNFNLDCNIEFEIRKNDVNNVCERLQKINGLTLNLIRT